MALAQLLTNFTICCTGLEEETRVNQRREEKRRVVLIFSSSFFTLKGFFAEKD
jgi:hypothetical protein